MAASQKDFAQAFNLQENQYYADYEKNITFFMNLIFCHREIVKLDHFPFYGFIGSNALVQYCEIHLSHCPIILLFFISVCTLLNVYRLIVCTL